MTKKILALLLLIGCAHTPTVQPEPASYTADIVLRVDTSAPPGFWMQIMPLGDTANRIGVDHYDSLRCTYFMADSIPNTFVILYGGVNKQGTEFSDFVKLIWAPSPKKNHLDITADSAAIHTKTNRTVGCGQ